MTRALPILLLLTACSSQPASPDGGTLAPRIAYCVTAFACNLEPPRALSTCASTTDGPPLDVQMCIAAAGSDCAAARACTYDATHTSLCTFGEKPACDGTVALTCDGATTTTTQTDCALASEQCVVGPTRALCALGTCDGAQQGTYCSGQIAAYCVTPFLLGEDCAAEQATCEATDGGASCLGSGASCIVPLCDSATGDLLPCKDGRLGRVHCPDGERCIPPTGNTTAAICGVASDCDPSTHFDKCLDGVLTYCDRGKAAALDCRALGFAGCMGSPSSGCVVSLVEDGGAHPLTDLPLP